MDTVTSPDKDYTIKRRRRRSPAKGRSTRRTAATTPTAPANEAIKTLPVAWIESPPLIGPDAPVALASKAVAAGNVFHAPAVILASTRRPAFAQIRIAVTRLLFLTSAVARQATAGFVNWRRLGIRTAMQRRIESPPLIGPDAPVLASKAVAASNVFHAPAVMLAPSRRSAFAQIRAAVAQMLFLTAAAARQTIAGFVHRCGLGVRNAVQRVRRVDVRAAAAAVSSFGRWLARLISVATRAMAVILSGLAFYAAFALAPASPDPAIETGRSTPPPSANVTTVGLASPVTTPGPAQPKPADEKPVKSAKAANQASSNVKIINAPHMKTSCREQTWPYISQHCLAALNGKIDRP